MATLTGNSIATTYTGLLSVSGAVGADTVEAVTDGAGTSTSLSLSQERATITLGSGAADDFIVDGTTLVVEGDNNRVGIGTATPDSLTEWYAASGRATIKVTSNDATASEILFERGTGGSGSKGIVVTSSGMSFVHTNDEFSSTSTHMHIDASGSVGIGTTSPNTLPTSGATVLTIKSSDSTANVYGGVLELQNSDADATNDEFGKIEFQNLNAGSSVTGRAIIVVATPDGVHNSSQMKFYTMNAGTAINALTINSNGGVNEPGGVLKENLLTNSGFDVWSNSTLENATGTKLHPQNNATDPDANTDSTSGWSAHNGATLSSEESVGGFSGSVLKVLDTSGADGSAIFTATTVVGKLYKLVFTQKNGDNRGFVSIGSSANGGQTRAQEALDNASATVKTIVFEATVTTTYISLGSLDDNDYCYFGVVSLYEVTPGCGADLAPDGWGNGTATGLLTMRREHDGSNTKEGSFYALRANWTNTNSNYAVSQDLGVAGVLERFQGRTITFGCWIKVEAGTNGYITIHDSAGRTDSPVHTTSTYTWVEVTRTIATSATSCSVALYHTGNVNPTTIYFSQPMLVFGSSIGEGNYTRPQGEIVWFEKFEVIQDDVDPLSTDDGILNLEALSSGVIPKGVKAVCMTSQVLNSSITSDQGIRWGKDSTYSGGVWNYPLIDNVYSQGAGWTSCDSNGDIYQKVTESGDTLSGLYQTITGVQLR